LDWATVEASVGLRLPADCKRLVEKFPDGTFQGLVRLNRPTEQRAEFLGFAAQRLDDMRERRKGWATSRTRSFPSPAGCCRGRPDRAWSSCSGSFVDRYGGGTYGDITIAGADALGALLERAYAKLRDPEHGTHDVPVYPEPGGLVTWGRPMTGGSAPGRRPIVIRIGGVSWLPTRRRR
jgi:hypothetical protein